jgi:DNA polymerase-1
MPKPITLIIDANNFIAVAAHANPMLTAPDGTPSGGLYASLRMLRTLLNVELLGETVDRIYMAYDAGRPAFRTELCPTYKAERAKRRDTGADDFYEKYQYQVRESKRLYRCLGAIIASASGYEADDLIAGIARHDPSITRAVIVSGDKDLHQLVRPNVRAYLPSRHEFVTRRDVPAGYLLMRCLTGDKSDNIPGVGGIGDVYAKRIVESLGEGPYTPKSLLAYMRANPTERFAAKILERRQQLRVNWRVMNLSRTSQAAYTAATFQHGGDRQRLTKLCRRLGFKSILRDRSTYMKLPSTLRGHE